MKERLKEIMNRTEWFRADRFGMFIHWGLYAHVFDGNFGPDPVATHDLPDDTNTVVGLELKES